MKPMTSAAVLGLVPIPLAPDTHPLSAEEGAPSGNDDAQSVIRSRYDAAERLATADELARLRRELGINVGDSAED